MDGDMRFGGPQSLLISPGVLCMQSSEHERVLVWSGVLHLHSTRQHRDCLGHQTSDLICAAIQSGPTNRTGLVQQILGGSMRISHWCSDSESECTQTVWKSVGAVRLAFVTDDFGDSQRVNQKKIKRPWE